MLHIILSILKIIGIMLLVLLGVIVIFLLLVLIAPLSYSLDGKKEEEIQFHAKLSWLLFAFRIRMSFEKKRLQYSIKVLGFLLAGNEEKRKKKVRKKKKQKATKKEKKKENTKEKLTEEEKHLFDEIQEEVSSVPRETKKKKPKKDSKEPKKTEKKEVSSPTVFVIPEEEEVKEDKRRGKKGRVFAILQAIPNKIVAIVEGTFQKIGQSFQKIKNLKDKGEEFYLTIKKWMDFMAEEMTKTAFSHAIKIIKKLLKHILPRKMKGELKIGVEDPTLMGKILAGLGMAMPLYKNNLTIQPYFGVNIIEGNFEGKGRIHLIYILYLALRVYMDKYIMGTIKKSKTMMSGKDEEGE